MKPDGSALRGADFTDSTLTPTLSRRPDRSGYWNRTPIEPTSAVSRATMWSAAMRRDVGAGGGGAVDEGHHGLLLGERPQVAVELLGAGGGAARRGDRHHDALHGAGVADALDQLGGGFAAGDEAAHRDPGDLRPDAAEAEGLAAAADPQADRARPRPRGRRCRGRARGRACGAGAGDRSEVRHPRPCAGYAPSRAGSAG